MSNSQLKNTLKDALSCLPKKEALVIQLYYVEELNVYEIAELFEQKSANINLGISKTQGGVSIFQKCLN